MEEFTVTSTSWHSGHVNEPIVIYQKELTRCIFVADTNDTKLASGEIVSGTIIHQRRNKFDAWDDISDFKLTQLKSGEGVKLHLNSEQTKAFYDGLTKLYEIAKEGVWVGTKKWAIAEADKILEVPENRIEFIRELLEKDYAEEVWQQLINDNPDLATRLSLSRLQEERIKSLTLFENYLTLETDENSWQHFFTVNEWIFGYGLKYVFLQLLEEQADYGGSSYKGTGTQRGDYLTTTTANIRFTVLVEIKKASTEIFKKERNSIKEYRNGACQFSDEFIGAITQLQMNCKSWEETSSHQANFEDLSEKDIFTVNPRGILIIGNTAEIAGNRNARRTFEVFRTNLGGIEIITFDELYERAKFIAHNDEPSAMPPADDGFADSPF